MNVRIVLHLMATYWRQHRWLIVAYGLMLVICASIPLSFSPERMQIDPRMNPPSSVILTGWSGDPLSSGMMWRVFGLGWTLSALGLVLAGTLGFHMLGWIEGRPLRRVEAITAKVLNFLILLVIPILTIAAAVPLSQGLGWSAAFGSVMDSAGVIIPRYAVFVLVGMICGGWWRWLAGVFVLVTILIVSAILLDSEAFLDWFWNPLAVSPLVAPPASMWLPLAILAILIPIILKESRTVPRIALAAMVIGPIPALLPKHRYHPSPGESLPDWSNQVELVLENQSLQGELDGRRSSMDLTLDWTWLGSSPDVFVDLTRQVRPSLRSGGEKIATARRFPEPYITSEQAAISAKLASASGEAISNLASTRQKLSMPENFTPVEPNQYQKAVLQIGLSGTAYRMEKIIDVRIGESVKLSIDGSLIHVRRRDPWAGTTLVEVCMIYPGKRTNFGAHPSMLDAWHPFIRDRNGAYREARKFSESRGWISPGCFAVHAFYILESNADPDDARFVVLKRKNLGHIRRDYRSAELPFEVTTPSGAYSMEVVAQPGTNLPDLPPGPASGATQQQIDAWLRGVAGMHAREDWRARGMKTQVADHLDLFLSRASPSATIPEGSALVMACPESRKGEVFAALPLRNRQPHSNWLSSVVLERGWAEDAAPQVRQLVKEGGLDSNPFSLLLAAALEDPSTYEALAEGAASSPWYSAYARVRNVPGIEPALGEAIAKQYQAIKKAGFDLSEQPEPKRIGVGRLRVEKFSHCIIPAAHGIEEAFSDLLAAWQELKEPVRSARLREMGEVIMLPEGDTPAAKAVLRGKKAADFHYDPLARQWIPVKPAK